MRLNKIIISLITCLMFSALTAQNSDIHIKLISKRNEPISDVTISIIKRSDSSKRITKLTDSTGATVFVLANGQYIVNATALNYKILVKGITVNTDRASNFVWVLEPSSNKLEDVTVVSRKPIMRQEDDKTIVEPENLVMSSSNGYEVLEKVPGLYIDQDGKVYISSTTPATVYINGRDMKMSTDDMATLLKNLSPNDILSIEILRTPSAKYDASGTGGIVNVILKKGVKIGTTGSITAGWQQGNYGNEFAGFSLNNSKGDLTSYLNLNLAKRNNFDHLISNRYLSSDSLLSQDANTTYPSNAYFLGYGVGYNFNKKWSGNYDGKLSYNDFDNVTNNSNLISSISSGQKLVNSTGNVKNKGKSEFISQDFSSLYKIDSVGSEWTNSLSYSYSKYNSDQDYSNYYTLPVIANSGGNGSIDNSRNLVLAQSDLKLKFAKNILMETGLKTSFLNYQSVTGFFKSSSGSTVPDNFRTNTFKYTENINSAYLQASKSFGSVILKLGARVENTNMNGHQTIPSDTSFSVHRTDLFPYIYLSRPVMHIAGYELRAYLVYRRSITRPPYDYLNPFPKYVDQYLYETGNPNLRPQFTQNYEANISVNDKPIVAVGYNDTKDVFTNVVYQSTVLNNVAYRTYDNLGKNKEIYFRALGVIPPGRRYFFVFGVQYNHNLYDGYYENSPLLYKRGSWTVFTFHSFKIDKLSVITLNGFVRLNGQQQFYNLATFGSLNASINRKLFKEKLTVTLSGNDILNTLTTGYTTNVGSINAYGSRATDSKRIGINLRYNFGFNHKEEKKNIFNIESPEKQN